MSDPQVVVAINNLSAQIDAITRRISLIEQYVDSHHRTLSMMGEAVASLNNRLNQLPPPIGTNRMQL